jgi:hypothetical protein
VGIGGETFEAKSSPYFVSKGQIYYALQIYNPKDITIFCTVRNTFRGKDYIYIKRRMWSDFIIVKYKSRKVTWKCAAAES